jgi:hypothetical protein
MNPRIEGWFKVQPVAPAAQENDVEVWEPPFERWMRIADKFLAKAQSTSKRTPVIPVPAPHAPFSR